jgi:hypothetical protein
VDTDVYSLHVKRICIKNLVGYIYVVKVDVDHRLFILPPDTLLSRNLFVFVSRGCINFVEEIVLICLFLYYGPRSFILDDYGVRRSNPLIDFYM